MTQERICVVRGLGFYVPDNVLTNADLEQIVETSDEWITTRTGIRERRRVSEGQTNSDLCLAAAQDALSKAGIAAEELTHILVATCTPDTVIPSASCMLADKLGVKGAMSMDIAAACSGFTYGLETARGIVALQSDAKILLCGADVLTPRVNWEDRGTCVLFGDGAGAAVLTSGRTEEPGAILDAQVASDGSLGNLLTIRGGGSAYSYGLGQPVGPEYFIQMEGREVFKHAVRSMVGISNTVLKRNNLSIEDVDILIPHQANIRIIEAVGKKLRIAPEKVFVNVDRYGNTSAASVPIALAEARSLGTIKDGDLALVVAFGGGFTWGSALIRY